MLYLAIKAALSGIIIAIVSEVARRNPGWGALIAEGANNIQSAPWLLIFPAIFFVLTLFSLNFAGDGLRDALDPKDR